MTSPAVQVYPVAGFSTTWCAAESWFANTTASPVTIVSVFGTKPLCVIARVVVAAGVDEATVVASVAAVSTRSFFMIYKTPKDEFCLVKDALTPGVLRCALMLDDGLGAAPGVDVATRHLGRRHVDPDRPAAARNQRPHEVERHDSSGLHPERQHGT